MFVDGRATLEVVVRECHVRRASVPAGQAFGDFKAGSGLPSTELAVRSRNSRKSQILKNFSRRYCEGRAPRPSSSYPRSPRPRAPLRRRRATTTVRGAMGRRMPFSISVFAYRVRRAGELFLAGMRILLDRFSRIDISAYQHAKVLNNRSRRDARSSSTEPSAGYPREAHSRSAVGQGGEDEDTAMVEGGC
jgi:hypothetical protein